MSKSIIRSNCLRSNFSFCSVASLRFRIRIMYAYIIYLKLFIFFGFIPCLFVRGSFHLSLIFVQKDFFPALDSRSVNRRKTYLWPGAILVCFFTQGRYYFENCAVLYWKINVFFFETFSSLGEQYIQKLYRCRRHFSLFRHVQRTVFRAIFFLQILITFSKFIVLSR